MAWFKVDDGFYTSHKVLSIPRSQRATALGVWLMVGTWSADKMTDGLVPHYILEEYGCTPEIREALVLSGLWKIHDNGSDHAGIEFHDWCEYQPTREQMMAKREETHAKKVAAGRKGAEARWHKDSKAIAENSKAIASDSPEPEPEPEPHKNTSSPKAMSFDEFWGVWPRKEGKANAVKAYEKALKLISEPELLEKVRAYVSSPTRPDVKFVPHAATWLNGERWLDDFAPAKPDIDPDWWMYPQESVSV